MEKPSNKHELLAAISSSIKKLGLELDTLPPVLFNDKSIQAHVDGLKINACELISHAIGWTKLALKWISSQRKDEPFVLPEEDYTWDELDRLSLSFYKRDKAPFRELRIQLDDTNTRLISSIEECDNILLYGTTLREDLTLGHLIHRYITSLHEEDHMRIRIWKKGLGWI